MPEVSAFQPQKEHRQLLESVQAQHDAIVIARAGAGKTATLQWLAEQCPTLRILYLVFDSSSRSKARSTFPANVRVETGHSLAFRLCVRPYPNRLFKFEQGADGRRISGAQIRQMIGDCAFERVSHTDMSTLIRRCLQRFQRSADNKVSDAHVQRGDFPKKVLAAESRVGDRALRHHVVVQARRLWRAMLEPDTPIVHDTYLKWLQLFAPRLNYDVIVCDEWQDANPVICDLVDRQGVPTVKVGDPAQQIYTWRDAINGLALAQDARRHSLTRSFRCSPSVTDKANTVLAVTGQTPLMESACRDCDEYPDDGDVDPTQPLTVIARTNRTLAAYALDYAQRGIAFAVVGGIQPILQQIDSALMLYEGRQTRDEWVGQFENWQQLKDAVADSGDLELSHLVSFIERHGKQSRQCLGALERAGKADQSGCARTLMSAHQSKGLEWEQVHLCSDLAPSNALLKRLESGESLSVPERETLNALYVGITRARRACSMDQTLVRAMQRMEKMAAVTLRGIQSTPERSNLNTWEHQEAS